MDTHTPFKRSALAGAILTVLAAPQANAGILPPLTAIDASEQQVNTSTIPTYKPVVASDADGDFVVVWTTPPAITDHCDISARKYNSDGTPDTAVIAVATVQGTGCYTQPDVAMDADGDFAVAWTDWASPTFNVLAQRFDKTGTAQGATIQVATSTATENNARIAMDADGDFAVAWQHFLGNSDVYLQRYDSTGVAQGSAQLVHATSTLAQGSPDIAMDADGDLIAIWNDATTPIKARLFPAGSAPGTEFDVTTTTNAIMQPRVESDADGDFVISWKDTTASQIVVRGFDNTGAQLFPQTWVATPDVATQADVAVDADGDFAVVWGYWNTSVTPNVIDSFVQRFDRTGNVIAGSQFNSSVDGGESSSNVAMDADGDIIIAWEPDYDATDGGNQNTYFRRYQGPEDVDLAVATSASPDPVPVGDTLTYTATVTNNHTIVAGTTASQDLLLGAVGTATGVSLSDTLPSGSSYVSASGSGWSCSAASGTVNCNLAGGLLPTAASAVTVTITAPATVATLSNSATVSANQLDSVTANNSDVLDTAMCNDYGTIALTAATATIAENGTSVTLTVSRSGGSCDAVSVDYATADGTATGGTDYTAASGTLSWAAGDIADKSITVTISDDTAVEGDEEFTLTLSNPSLATLGTTAAATITISDDDTTDTTTPTTSGGGGGGATAPWWLAMLGLPLLRRRRR